MDGKIAKEFNKVVDVLLETEQEKEQLYGYLKEYRSTLELDSLLARLKALVNCPERVPLFEACRPLIPLRHQLPYDRLAHRLVPSWPSHCRLIRLVRNTADPVVHSVGGLPAPGGGGMGFGVRGGLEHQVGFYVADVVLDSQAWKHGLRIGDEILRMNGFPMDQVTHEEAISLIRSRSELILKVRRIGLLPSRRSPDDQMKWEYACDIAPEKSIQSEDNVSDSGTLRRWKNGSNSTKKTLLHEEVLMGQKFHIFFNLEGVETLGCSICSGPGGRKGVFVQSIQGGGMAAEAGLSVGDEMIEANGLSLSGLSHSHAVLALRSSPHLLVTLRKGTGLDLFSEATSPDEMIAKDKEMMLRQLTIGDRPRPVSDSGFNLPSTSRGASGTSSFNAVSLNSSLVHPAKGASQHHGNFTRFETGGRDVDIVELLKIPGCEELGFEVEGGSDSPLAGKVAIATVYDGTPAKKGGLHVGDYLLVLDGTKVCDMPLAEVQDVIKNVEDNSAKSTITLVIAKAAPGMYREEEVTYF